MSRGETGRRGGSRRSEDVQLRAEYLRLKGAVYDPNTDLLASPARMESVRALFHRTRSVGVVHVEIDPLSRVETVYGWQVLDCYLKKVAEELATACRELLPAESILCQTGIHAARFLLFVPTNRAEPFVSLATLEETCLLLEARLSRRFSGAEFRSMTPRPSFCVGASTIVEHPFYRLERQIYHGIDEARQAGLKGEARERARHHAELKRIIRDQRIETLFQPIVELATGRIIGYEAFTRGPRNSAFESPSSLFQVSREVGMSGELDLMCQRAALRRARKLSTGDKLFINALPASLLDPGFREGLLAELPDGFPISRRDIILEIADRDSVDDAVNFGSEVTELRARGFGMSIDDVGKVSSSLESLAEVKPDYIKVDHSIIRNIDKNLIKQEMLRSLCEVARGMNTQVIAVGIETVEERDAVIRCGAPLGQGY
ncbi:MAG TPA: EAL domain-containing protein, partial [Candidatus Polarisedimenticolia bacterium]|nr:EAL domain-containing protein [Candidatus Polarisedimenticolia bacterium]